MQPPPYGHFNGVSGGCGYSGQQGIFSSQPVAQPPAAVYSPTATQATTAEEKYGWAAAPDLWGGRDFVQGVHEHSGKILILLTLLQESVKAGDKMLVFSQSLLTLDLIERVLARLPLNPEEEEEEKEAKMFKGESAFNCVRFMPVVDDDTVGEAEVSFQCTRWRRKRAGFIPEPRKVWTRNINYLRESYICPAVLVMSPIRCSHNATIHIDDVSECSINSMLI